RTDFVGQHLPSRPLREEQVNSVYPLPLSTSAPELCIVRPGRADETGANYTRLLVTDPSGPNEGAIFLSAEVYVDETADGRAFPVWRSDDDGRSWSLVAQVVDSFLGMGNRYQPSLFELSVEFGGYPRGSLLLAGNAIPEDMSETHIVIYASVDRGETWSFVSQVDAGGPAIYDSSAHATTTAVWEPDLFMADGQLVCVYADEREKDRGMLQVLVHRTTKDLRNWDEPVIDFGVSDGYRRPGMLVGTGELPDGSYKAVFEVVGPTTVPVYIASSTNGLSWGAPDDLGQLLVSTTGTTLSGSPNVAWRVDADGQVNLLVTGRLSIEADGTESNLALINLRGGRGEWRSLSLPVSASRHLDLENSGYSQSLTWTNEGALLQATSVLNALGSHDIVVARVPTT
ncbi:sialidase family protein, partial [Cryobacterium lactosi]|uniref:sialidase family protein n=1 Tax=Cryobacterium lactosi TaxID=1259202 RepID=UPI001A7E23FA